MASPFETVILRLKDLGMFQFFLPFMLSAAIFYGLLRKSKLFGEGKENVTVNAVVAMVASFMVWASPIITGVSIEVELAKFFTQAMLAMVVILVGLLALTMFVPAGGLGEKLKEFGLGKRFYMAVLVAAILVAVGVLVSSGLIVVFFPSGISVGGGLSNETIITIGILILMVGTVAILVIGGK